MYVVVDGTMRRGAVRMEKAESAYDARLGTENLYKKQQDASQTDN